MGDLGSGSGSSYPTALDTQSTPEVNSPNAGKTKARAEVPNDSIAAILAIQGELGTDPAGTLTDVKTYLQTEHNADGTHDATKIVEIAGAQTITGDKTLSGTTTLGPLAGAGWPSFSVHRDGTAQSINDTTDTKIEFDTEEWDTNSDFDPTTNYRFTPTVAGKYQLTLRVQMGALGSGNIMDISIRKNGATYKRHQMKVAIASWGGGMTMTIIVDANGTTDYFEAYIYQNSGAGSSMTGLATDTYFQGSRIA